MMIGGNAYRKRFRLMSVVTLLAILGSLVPAPAHAWKPKTHVFFADEAWKDATDDGKVTIYKVDYASGTVGDKLGDYAVDATMLEALKAHPQQYRAGVLGPDAYPDIFIGQQLIHPDNDPQNGTISNQWLEHLWNVSATEQGAIKAFVIGYLTHAAGDMYGHTFVNTYTGAPFKFGTNAVKHIVVEGYVGKRTPDPPADVSIGGVETFIYDHLVNAHPGSKLREELLVGPEIDLTVPYIFSDLQVGSKGHLTVPYVFSTLRAVLQSEISDYNALKVHYDSRAEAKRQAAADCGPFDFSCSRIALRTQQAAILAEKAAYVTVNGVWITYSEHWRDDIDEGLKVWPALNHKFAEALIFNAEGADITAASDAVDEYVNAHLLSMAGAPDAVGDTRALIGNITDEIADMMAPLRDRIDAMKRELQNFVLKQAIGMTVEEVEQYLKNPEIHFDPVMLDLEGPGEEISLATFNKDVLKISDAGYSNAAERFDYRDIPAAYNSVTISKLILLSPEGMTQLLKDLNAAQTLESPNVMLGFIRSLDDSNEWHKHAHAKMVFAWDCTTYRQIFMQQKGEQNGCDLGLPEQTTTLTLDSDTAAAVSTCQAGLLQLTKNVYKHPQQPSDLTSHTTWKTTYETFKTTNLPSCDKVGVFVTNNLEDSALAGIKADMAEDGVAKWEDYWEGDGKTYGISFHGGRIGTYCPGLHTGQYDCVEAPKRINKGISAVNPILSALAKLK